VHLPYNCFFALSSTFSKEGICPQELPKEGILVVEGHKNIWWAFIPRVGGIFGGQRGIYICPPLTPFGSATRAMTWTNGGHFF
jgi:hypothetical protein